MPRYYELVHAVVPLKHCRCKSTVKEQRLAKFQTLRKRPKYQAPHREHPDTDQTLDEQDIHANHVEAQNAALRRKYLSTTNEYAKSKEGLQRTLDVHQIIHNFVRVHWTHSSCGCFAGALGLEDIYHILNKLLCVSLNRELL